MDTILIVHNPKAGDQDHAGKTLIKTIKAAGYHCIYESIKEEAWKRRLFDVQQILIVGGDGTVRRVVAQFQAKRFRGPLPILSILPRGTANNLAKTWGGTDQLDQIIHRWKEHPVRYMDIGQISDGRKENFFIEGAGYGLLPRLMRAAQRGEISTLDRENELSSAIDWMIQDVRRLKARKIVLEVNKKLKIGGQFLLVEVLNIRSVGPNLLLAPHADITDGQLEVVLLEARNRAHFLTYLSEMKRLEIPENLPCTIIKGDHIKICYEGSYLHIDDELVRIKKDTSVSFGVLPNKIPFI